MNDHSFFAAAGAPDGPAADTAWWRDAVIYQVYPRSFQDSNGDGVGDLPGLLARLDYVRDLGASALWLSPIYPSPDVDNGYDVADYTDVDPRYGTLADLDAVVAAARDRGIRVLLDLVVNHSSDQHPWFRVSRAARTSPKRDWYVWRDPAPGGGPPNNWVSLFGGPAWTLDAATGQYYLHLFAPEQPDLNWEQPAVRHAVYGAMRFWLDRGVAGFRMDVFPFYAKRPGLPDLVFRAGEPPLTSLVATYVYGERLVDYLREMRREVFDRYPGSVALGEGVGVGLDDALRYVGPDAGALDLLYAFDHVLLADRDPATFAARPLDRVALKRTLAVWDAVPAAGGGLNVYLGNHDQPRALSRFGTEGPHRDAAATMLATLLLTLRGVPTIYNGDELGMANAPFGSVEDLRDVFALGAYRRAVAAGVTAAEFFRTVGPTLRDHARTPMPWDAGPQGGFTTGTPWIGVHPDAPRVNAAAEAADPDSVLAYYRRLTALRRATPALRRGTFEAFDLEHPQVFAYRRATPGDELFVVLNLADAAAAYALPPAVAGARGDFLIGNGAGGDAAWGAVLRLAPFDARVYRLARGRP